MQPLIHSTDITPAETLKQGEGLNDLLLVCEHGGLAIPTGLNQLGLKNYDLAKMHIAWDIGAREVAIDLAKMLGCDLILQNYSRLVIDCNRPPLNAQSIPKVSDGVIIDGNKNLSEVQKKQRVDEIFKPYDAMLKTAFKNPKLKAVFSIHSFTPIMNGLKRPWDIGFLGRCGDTAQWLKDEFSKKHPHLCVALNQPYEIEDTSDWLIPQYAEPRGMIHSLIEIKNDNLQTDDSRKWWAEALANTLTQLMKNGTK